MKLNNYDKIADYYDVLSRMVFFKSQVKAQLQQLKYIPARSKLLIVGGGTGWILEELSKVHQSGLEITYVEISANMIKLAEKRNFAENKVDFRNLPIEEFVIQEQYDVIVTAFLFDNFSKDRVSQVFSKLNHLLKPNGLWLFSDFTYDKKNGKMWQQLMLKGMYLFFNKIANIEAKELVDTEEYFKNCGLIRLITQKYYQGFIESIVYQKAGY